MSSLTRRAFMVASGSSLVLAAILPALLARTSWAANFFDAAGDGVALSGYDPVAYFTDGAPQLGSSDFTSQFDGATYRFASAEHKAQFDADPARFAPQYGGYCAFAVSRGATAEGDPNSWTLHNGKLYLNVNKAVRTLWDSQREANIAAADSNWPGLSGR